MLGLRDLFIAHPLLLIGKIKQWDKINVVRGSRDAHFVKGLHLH